ncbi:MAG: integrase [Betaproteobacteria bacterium RIFCSPLOWO2_12_61_14]|nr:MAG: integrase [Betaproteobacteria bacterium RIFCSPLOWO2_12_61_14]
MPGNRITDLQMNKYKELRRKRTQEAAAAKTGISVSSARRIESSVVLPSQRPPRHWRTRADPLREIWEAEVVPMLSGAPSLMAVTVFEELQRRHPERLGESVLRTLQRRVRQWRAENGTEREIFFAQEHPPGRLGLSDFTVANELGVSIGGLGFEHRLYQFTFAHSGWRHANIVLGGESFQALTSGLQDALWMAGGVPEEHRTDSLSAAFNNLVEQEELTRRYRELCAHYGLRASRNNLGLSHENGPIESRQGSLKRALDQALLLRGTREFADLPAYEQFVAETVRRLNARCARAWELERASLKPLPARRTVDFEEIDARVSKFGVFSAKSALYSVPSRLAGHRLKVRLYSAHLEAWLGGVKVFECERLYGSVENRHPKRIDWRHMLPSLKRKPGAFARWALRDAMFPRSEYAQAWELIRERLPERAACRLMVGLLDLADQANVVVELAGVLAALHERGELPEIEALRERFAPRPALMPTVQVVLPAVGAYDVLIDGKLLGVA